MSNLSALFSKKIGPVPVVYIAAGFVAILAVVAWRMKPADDGESGEVASDDGSATDADNPYEGLATTGTVVVQPQQPVPVEKEEPDRPDTNDEWVREGALWLVANHKVSGTAAYTALSKFVEGKSRSAEEVRWVELVIKEMGFPPDPFVNANPLPPTTPKPPVTPTPKPVQPAPGSKRGYGWYKVKKGDTAASISNKYGITLSTFYAFNGVDRIYIGEWVKVRATSNPTWNYQGH